MPKDIPPPPEETDLSDMHLRLWLRFTLLAHPFTNQHPVCYQVLRRLFNIPDSEIAKEMGITKARLSQLLSSSEQWALDHRLRLHCIAQAAVDVWDAWSKKEPPWEKGSIGPGRHIAIETVKAARKALEAEAEALEQEQRELSEVPA